MVETFQADKEGCYSPIQRDDNKDGIQDAYWSRRSGNE